MDTMSDQPKRKRGNPNMVKGGPSVNPSGRNGEALSLSKDIIAALKQDFNGPEGGTVFFERLRETEPKSYAAMLARILPAEINQTVTHEVLNLSEALADAQKRLDQQTQSKMIDITPTRTTEHALGATLDVERDTLHANPLKTKD